MALLSSSRPATVWAHVKPAPSAFILGGDISALSSIEQRGATYKDEGKSDDAIAIFTRHSWNCFRLRIFVNPNGRGGVVNSLDYTRALAKRIEASGASFMLDFHYSDTWADPQHQVKPAAWNDLNFDDLEKQVERYTAEVMKDLKDNGVTPQIVQIGNEITAGTLWPDAQVQVPPSDVKVFEGAVREIKPPQPYDDAKQWDHLTRVVKAGVRGVRAATTPADGVRTMIHIDCGGDWPVTKGYFDHMIDAGVEFDMIGQSYYPNWHGTIENVRQTLRETAARYKKDIVIVETAYPWKNAEYWAGRKNMAWRISPAGQKQFLAELVKTVRETPDGRGVGVVWWHPESVAIQGRGAWQGGAMALFDNDGNALPAIDVLKP
jgi:arabinogalactan endo-1,4-beta-galactosidase